MRTIPLQNEHFGFDGRGPEIQRFLHDRDAVKGGTFTDRRPLPGNIIGMEFSWFEHDTSAWVIFSRSQVVQIVPEEVCSYWFMPDSPEETRGVGIYVIEDSQWLSSFSQRHLGKCRHFILMFYDDIVEVLAEDLIFGRGPFRIEENPELSYYK